MTDTTLQAVWNRHTTVSKSVHLIKAMSNCKICSLLDLPNSSTGYVKQIEEMHCCSYSIINWMADPKRLC
jgi:hypothetical protein